MPHVAVGLDDGNRVRGLGLDDVDEVAAVVVVDGDCVAHYNRGVSGERDAIKAEAKKAKKEAASTLPLEMHNGERGALPDGERNGWWWVGGSQGGWQPGRLAAAPAQRAPVRQEKLRSVVSSTARGLVMSRKSAECGCSLTNVPLGSVAERSCTTSPSCSSRFCIICRAAEGAGPKREVKGCVSQSLGKRQPQPCTSEGNDRVEKQQSKRKRWVPAAAAAAKSSAEAIRE